MHIFSTNILCFFNLFFYDNFICKPNGRYKNRLLRLYLILVGGKVEDEPGGAKHGDDEESRTEDPPALVVVPLDLEDGDAVEQAQHQEDGRVHVQQQERFL